VTLNPPIPPSPFPYAVTQYGYGGGNGGGGSVSCAGEIAATFNWVPTAVGDLPPDNVIVKETCAATWQGYSIGPPPSGACDNGLGFAAVDQGPIPGVPSPPFTTRWYRASGTRYRVVAGAQTLTIRCTPTASASSPIFASASVYYTADVYPVLVRMSGANVHDWMFHPYMIVGAGATASISTGPLYQHAWSWSVSGGDAFSDYATVPANSSTPSSSVRTPLTPTDQETTHFYFAKWENGDDATVACETHVAVPQGATPAEGLDVSGHLLVHIDKPNSTVSVYMGSVQLVEPPLNTFGLWLWGATGENGGLGGIVWDARVTTPALAYGDEFNPGGWNYTQLVTPNRTWGPPAHSFIGGQGLDTSFGYDPAWPGLFQDDGTLGEQGDSPSTTLVAPVTYCTMNDSFVTYMLYRPPGQDTKLVALKNWQWYAAGVATWDPYQQLWQASSTGSGWEFVDDFPFQPIWSTRWVAP
jgi:hypothetical protein